MFFIALPKVRKDLRNEFLFCSISILKVFQRVSKEISERISVRLNLILMQACNPVGSILSVTESIHGKAAQR